MKHLVIPSVIVLAVTALTFGKEAHAAGSLCRLAVTNEATSAYSPVPFTAKAVQETLSILRTKTVPNFPTGLHLQIEPSKHGMFGALYESGALESGRMTLLLGDKLIAAKALESILGSRFREFSPRGVGLKEFLITQGIVDASGRVTKSAREIATALEKYFPDGVVLKPIESQASDGIGIMTKPAEIAALLVAQSPKLYTPNEIREPSAGSLSNAVLSGERFFLMDKIKGSVLDGRSGRGHEFRLHVLNGRVLDGATVARWYDSVPQELMAQAEAKAQEFLDLLPKAMTRGQAYSLDLITLENGGIQLIEINTNRGRFMNTWSGFTVEPKILKAHAIELEKQYGWKFEGAAGVLLRAGLANVRRYVKESYLQWTYDVARGESQPPEMVEDLKVHVEALITPFLKQMESIPRNQWTSEIRSDVAFAQEYRKLIADTKSYGDPAWKAFVDWMEVQLK